MHKGVTERSKDFNSAARKARRPGGDEEPMTALLRLSTLVPKVRKNDRDFEDQRVGEVVWVARSFSFKTRTCR